MNKAEILSCVEEETGFKRKEWGGFSIGFTDKDSVNLHILKVGKKVKGGVYTKTMNNFSLEEALEFAITIKEQLVINSTKAGTTVSRSQVREASKKAKELEDGIHKEEEEKW